MVPVVSSGIRYQPGLRAHSANRATATEQAISFEEFSDDHPCI
jgi:hypothetical protein